MKMNELRKLFSETILHSSQSSTFSESILPGGKLERGSALAVYEEGYIVRLSQALGERFETVWRILGDEDFFETCNSYIRRYPSRSYNLSDYGEYFSQFLGELFPEHDFIRETAEFEFELSTVFHLSENKILELRDSVSGKNPNDLRFEFHESLKFLHYSHSIYELWKNKKSEKTPELPILKSQYILLGKTGNDLFVKEIDEWEWNFGKYLLEGKTVLQATESSGEMPEGTESISGFLSGLARAGFIKGIKIS